MDQGQQIAPAAADDLARWMVQASPDGLWVLDTSGRTVFANDRMAELLGREPAEMIDFDAFRALDGVGQEQLRVHLLELESGGERGDNIECSLLRKDGSRLEALISHSPIIDDHGRLRGWLHRVSEYTEQRLLLETLQRREQQLAEAQSIARIGSWEWDIVSDSVSWSDELYRIYGLTPQEHRATYAGFLEGIHPEDRDRVHETVSALFRTGESFEFDARIVRSTGMLGWLRGRGIVVRDDQGAPVRMSGTAQDITGVKDAEQALALLGAVATAANDADTLADGVPAAVEAVVRHTSWRAQAAYLVRHDGTLDELSLGAQAPAAASLSADARPLAGRSAAEARIVVLEQTDSLLLAAPLLAEGGVAGVIVLSRQGTVLPEEWEGATVAQAMALFGRVTERERASAALQVARDDAMSASRAKSEFLTTMSHEIRTPLNGVIGLSELLGRTELSERQRRLTDGIEEAGRALLGLVNDILDLSKIEAGQLDLEEVDFDPRSVIEQSVSLVAEAARAKSLELVIACQPELPSLVRGDPVRLGQVVANLASNAVKFTSSGEVIVRAGLDGCAGQGTRIRVEVVDTGMGIAEAEQGRLFEAFAQADSSTTRQFGGTGLGLAICRQIVEAIGGDIGVVSSPGAGSTFWFTAAFRPPLDERSSRTPVLESAVRGMRVLVVDDHETNRHIMLEHLAAWSTDCQAAGSAAEGLTLLDSARQQGRPFEMVLLDYVMPGMDGLEFARRARRDGHRDLRLLLLTSAVEPSADLLAEAGIDAVMSKPVLSLRLLEGMAALRGISAHGTRGMRLTGARSASPTGRSVLLVEDNPVNQMVAEGILGSLGYAVVLAENGRVAVERFAEDPERFDAVLMDCQMPVMDGYDATRTIRAMEEPTRRVPIVALTAAAVAGERERCLEAGMDDFLTKPVDVEALRATMQRWTVEASSLPAVDPDVLDSSRLAELLDLDPGDPSMLLRFIGRFGHNARDTMTGLRAAQAAGTAYEVGRLAHGLKGSAANLGAHRLAAVCKHIEYLADDGVLAEVAELDSLAREVDAAASALVEFAATLSVSSSDQGR